MADDANSSPPPVPKDGRGALPLWGEALLYIGALLLCFVVGCACIPYTDDIFDPHRSPFRMVMMVGFFYGVPLVTVLSLLAILSKERSTDFWLSMGVFVGACYAMGWLLVLCVTSDLFYLSDAYLGLLIIPPVHQFIMGILTIAACIVMACTLPASCVPAARSFGRHALWATAGLFLVSLAASAACTYLAA